MKKADKADRPALEEGARRVKKALKGKDGREIAAASRELSALLEAARRKEPRETA